MILDKFGWLIGAIIYLAILFVLVRPGSNGPGIVKYIGLTLSDLVRGATGEEFDGTKWSAAQ